MRLLFPSSEFDDVVAGVCHGSATEAEMRALNELLRSNANVRDEYCAMARPVGSRLFWYSSIVRDTPLGVQYGCVKTPARVRL